MNILSSENIHSTKERKLFKLLVSQVLAISIIKEIQISAKTVDIYFWWMEASL